MSLAVPPKVRLVASVSPTVLRCDRTSRPARSMAIPRPLSMGDRWQSDPEATYRIPDLARLGYDVPACLLHRPDRPLDSGAE